MHGKIGARAARATAKHCSRRYYTYEIPGRGQFRFHEDPLKMQAEILHEGKHILKTDDPTLGPVEAVGAYKESDSVEPGFRDLKDVIEMRPVCHFPPSTSKWNRIAHRMFLQITTNRRGRPLVSHEVMIKLIAHTTPATGLQVRAGLDRHHYPTDEKVSKPGGQNSD